MDGEPSGGGALAGMIPGMAGVPVFTRASTLVGPPLTHLLPLKVCSQCSFAAHSPLQGSGSHSPLVGLQVVPLVHIAMHPPDARPTAAAPMARAVTLAAPAPVFELPVLQAVSRATANKVVRSDMVDLPSRLV